MASEKPACELSPKERSKRAERRAKQEEEELLDRYETKYKIESEMNFHIPQSVPTSNTGAGLVS